MQEEKWTAVIPSGVYRDKNVCVCVCGRRTCTIEEGEAVERASGKGRGMLSRV